MFREILWKRQANNATVDQRTSEVKRETTIIEMVIKSCAKGTLGLDTKKIMLTSVFSQESRLPHVR